MEIFNREVVLQDGTTWFVARRKTAREWVGVSKKKERSFSLEDIAEVKAIVSDRVKGPWL